MFAFKVKIKLAECFTLQDIKHLQHFSKLKFSFIIANAENTTLHKYAVQKDKNMYRVTSEFLGADFQGKIH